MSVFNSEQQEIILCSLRAQKLEAGAVPDQWGSYEIQKVNAFIFQDLGESRNGHYTPGVFRPEVPPGMYWRKHRPLLSRGDLISPIVYSSMTDDDRRELDRHLRSIRPERLRELGAPDFGTEIASLYVALDFIHPFPDGNSRTLRCVTQMIARSCGFVINWSRFSETPAMRDRLYVARDLCVNRIAFSRFPRNSNVAEEIYDALQLFRGEPDLFELFGEREMIRRQDVPKMRAGHSRR